MKRLSRLLLAIVLLAIVCFSQFCIAADPSPAQLQQILADYQALVVATSADTTAINLVVTDSAALTQAQTVLANDTAAQAATAATVNAAVTQLQADVALLQAAQAKQRAIMELRARPLHMFLSGRNVAVETIPIPAPVAAVEVQSPVVVAAPSVTYRTVCRGGRCYWYVVR